MIYLFNRGNVVRYMRKYHLFLVIIVISTQVKTRVIKTSDPLALTSILVARLEDKQFFNCQKSHENNKISFLYFVDDFLLYTELNMQ